MQIISRSGVRLALALAAASLLSACDFIDRALGVEPRSRIPAEQLENPANAGLLLAGAISDFECAAGAYNVVGGLIGEELADATQTANRYPYDQRNVQPADARYATFGCESIGVYTPLQTARVSLDRILGFLQQWTDAEVADRQEKIAAAAAYSGYAHILLAEGFCSAVLSTMNADGTINFGGEVEPDSVFRVAVARFNTAIAAAQAAGTDADAQQLLNFARVGQARALLGLGQLAEARAVAELVPASFRFDVTASAISSRRFNRIFDQNSATSTATSVGAPYRALNDPRVPVTNLNRSTTTGVPLFRQDKFTSAADPIRLASGEEAQLIVTEALIAAGQLDPARQIINAFRAQGNQAAIAPGATAAELTAALIDQRRRELFLEGQHLGDLLRFGITPTPAVGTAFPGGGVYSDQLCMPLPNVERLNNPVLAG